MKIKKKETTAVGFLSTKDVYIDKDLQTHKMSHTYANEQQQQKTT